MNNKILLRFLKTEYFSLFSELLNEIACNDFLGLSINLKKNLYFFDFESWISGFISIFWAKIGR